MDLFTAFLSIGISSLIILLTRYIDRDRFGLEKVKKFIDKKKEELDSFSLAKQQEIKDLTIDIDFNLKKGEAFLKRYEQASNDINIFFSQFDNQKTMITKLRTDLAKLDSIQANITNQFSGVKKEIMTLDAYKGRIGKIKIQIEDLESKFVKSQETIREQNNAFLGEVKETANHQVNILYEEQKNKVSEFEKEIEQHIKQVQVKFTENFQKIIQYLGTTTKNLEEKIAQKFQTAQDDFGKIEKKLEGFTEQLDHSIEDYKKELSDLSKEKIESYDQYFEEKHEHMEEVKDEIEKLADIVNQRIVQSIEKLTEDIEIKKSTFQNEADEMIQQQFIKINDLQTQNNQQITKLSQLLETFQAQADEILGNKTNEVSKYVSRIEERITGYKENIFKDIEKRFITLDMDAKEIVEKGKIELNNLIASYTSDMETALGKVSEELSNLKTQHDQIKTNYTSKFKLELEQLDIMIKEKLDIVSRKSGQQIEEFQEHLNSQLKEGEVRINDFNKEADEKLEQLKKNSTLILQELENKASIQKNSLEANWQNYNKQIGKINQEVEKRLESKQKEIELLVEQRLSIIYDKTEERVSNSEEKMVAVENQFKDQLSKLDRFYSGFNQVMDSKDKELSEKLESIEKGLYDNVAEKKNDIISLIERLKEETEVKIPEAYGKVNSVMEKVDKMSEITENLDEIKSEYNEKINLLAHSFNEEIQQKIENEKKEILEKIPLIYNDFNFLVEQKNKELKEKLTNEETSLDQKITDHQKEISDSLMKIREEIDYKLPEIQNKINTMSDKLDNIEKMNFDMEEMKKQYTEKIENLSALLNNELENKLGKEKSEILTKIPEIYEDFNQLIKQKNQDLQNILYDYENDLKNQLSSRQKDMALSLENIQEEIDRKIPQLQNKISSMDEKLQNIGNFNDNIDKIKVNYDERLSELVYQLNNDFTNKLEKEKEKLYSKIPEYFNEYNTIIQEKDKELNNKLEILEKDVESRILQRQKEITQYIQQIKDEIDIKMPEAYQKVDLINEKLERIEMFSERIDAVKTDYEKMLNSLSESMHDELQNKIDKEKEYLLSKIPEVYARVNTINQGLDDLKQDVEKDFSDLSGNLDYLKKKVESEFYTIMEKKAQEIEIRFEALNNQAQSIEKSVNDTLENKKKDMAQSFNSLEIEFQNLKQGFLENSKVSMAKKIDEIQKYVNDKIEFIHKNLPDLSGEFIGLKQNIEQDINGIEENVNKLNQEFSNKMNEFYNDVSKKENEFNKKYGDKLGYFEEEMKNLFQDYEQQTSKAQKEILDKFITLSEKNMETAQSSMITLDNEIKGTQSNFEQFKQELVSKIEGIKIDSKNGILEFLEDLKSKYEKEFFVYKNNLVEEQEKSKQTIKTMEVDLSREIEEAMESFKKRLNLFREEFSNLEKNQHFLERIETQITNTNKLADNVKENYELMESQIGEIELFTQKFGEINEEIDDFNKKISQLKADKKMVYSIENSFEKLLLLSQKAENNANAINDQIKNLEQIKQQINDIDNLYMELSKKSEYIKKIEAKIDDLGTLIEKNENDVTTIESKSNETKDFMLKIQSDLKDLEVELFGFDKNLKAVQKESSKIDAVLEKFTQMDLLVKDIETRNEQLQQARMWIAKTESRLSSLEKEADERIERLELLLEKSSTLNKLNESTQETGTAKIKDDKTSTILDLWRQNWKSDEIAKVTGKSVGEVDLIIELNNPKKK